MQIGSYATDISFMPLVIVGMAENKLLFIGKQPSYSKLVDSGSRIEMVHIRTLFQFW